MNTESTWKRSWFWERLKAGGEEGGRGWDDSIASWTQWTWIWANSGRQWRTEEPGVLQSMGSQRVRNNLTTEQQYIPHGEVTRRCSDELFQQSFSLQKPPTARHMEWRRTVPTVPWLNLWPTGSISLINNCFMPVNSGIICYAAIVTE